MCDVIKKPSECSENELENFYQLVLKGKQVDPFRLKERITERGRLLAFHYEEHRLVGVVGLKRPNEGYKRGIFESAGVSEDSYNYDLEIGWAFTEEEHRGRGICLRLIKKIFDLSKSQNFFATAHTNNASIHRVLEKTGFKKTGKPYLGRNGTYCQLFTRSKK